MSGSERPFVDWFRHCAPYIHAHRGRTFVVAFGGEAVADPEFYRLVHDLALLSSLGVRLVVVHGTRPQIEERLREAGIVSEFHRGLRITRPEALPCVKEAVGVTLVEIESKLSMSQPDSPMFGARVRVASGNFVTARPVGVRDGVDHWYTGEVRKVDAEGIKQRLDSGAVVLISNLGYSWTGEVFNLGVHEVASSVAEAVGADKLVCLTEHEGFVNKDGSLLREVSPSAVEDLLKDRADLSLDVQRWALMAARACLGGVRRGHLLSRHINGGLLQELYTRDGAGTLIAVEAFEGMRVASARDLPGILELIRPLEARGVLVARSRERLEREIDHFVVVERDGMVVACCALYELDQSTGEVSCFAVHPDYRKGGQGDSLLNFIERKAASQRLFKLFVLTTHTGHWFMERGYEMSDPEQLPVERRSLYNPQRNSKVLLKQLPNGSRP
ncbi:MAG: amino-acid N-acetyltransferase [Myxococcales bacterium]